MEKQNVQKSIEEKYENIHLDVKRKLVSIAAIVILMAIFFLILIISYYAVNFFVDLSGLTPVLNKIDQIIPFVFLSIMIIVSILVAYDQWYFVKARESNLNSQKTSKIEQIRKKHLQHLRLSYVVTAAILSIGLILILAVIAYKCVAIFADPSQFYQIAA